MRSACTGGLQDRLFLGALKRCSGFEARAIFKGTTGPFTRASQPAVSPRSDIVGDCSVAVLPLEPGQSCSLLSPACARHNSLSGDPLQQRCIQIIGARYPSDPRFASSSTELVEDTPAVGSHYDCVLSISRALFASDGTPLQKSRTSACRTGQLPEQGQPPRWDTQIIALGVGIRANAGNLGADFLPGPRHPRPLSAFPHAAHTSRVVEQPMTAGFGAGFSIMRAPSRRAPPDPSAPPPHHALLESVG